MTARPRSRANGDGSIFPYRAGYAAYTWVRTPTGERQRKYVYGRTREEVHAKWLELHRLADEGVIATKAVTLGEYLASWLRDVIRPNLAPLTYATYETLVRLYIVPGLGQKRLHRLGVRDVQTWLNMVRQTCTCCSLGKDAGRPPGKQRCCAVAACCGQVPSARTVRDLRAVLRSALSQAKTEDLVTKNVAALVKLPTGRTRKARAWSSDEARAFLESAKSDDDPLYAAYVLVLALGLRKGEVLGLRWEDVDLDGSELTIARQLQRVGGRLLHRETKTEHSDASLPLPSIGTAALALRRQQWASARLVVGEAWQASDLVFTTKYGTPIEPRNFNRAFTARCLKAGVPQITVHDARRTCATLLVDLDVHPRVVMQILRHAQFAVTMEIYAKASSRSTREALRKLGESLS